MSQLLLLLPLLLPPLLSEQCASESRRREASEASSSPPERPVFVRMIRMSRFEIQVSEIEVVRYWDRWTKKREREAREKKRKRRSKKKKNRSSRGCRMRNRSRDLCELLLRAFQFTFQSIYYSSVKRDDLAHQRRREVRFIECWRSRPAIKVKADDNADCSDGDKEKDEDDSCCKRHAPSPPTRRVSAAFWKLHYQPPLAELQRWRRQSAPRHGSKSERKKNNQTCSKKENEENNKKHPRSRSHSSFHLQQQLVLLPRRQQHQPPADQVPFLQQPVGAVHFHVV